MAKISFMIAVTIKCDKYELNINQRVVGAYINSNCCVYSSNFSMMQHAATTCHIYRFRQKHQKRSKQSLCHYYSLADTIKLSLYSKNIAKIMHT